MTALSLIWGNRTKLLGYAQVVMAALAIADQALINSVLGPNGMRWVLLSSGVLTAVVGHYNSLKRKPAKPPSEP